MSATEERTAYIGAPVKRREDEPLLTGRGTFVDNMTPVGTAFMVVVRSPYAHARVGSVDLTAARAADGVVAAFSAAELQDDWKAAMPCAWPVTEDMKNPPHYPLTDVARHQGDGVAVVIAESRAQAKDAAELVEIDWEPLDAIADVATALDDGAALAHPDLGSNECYVWRLDTDATGEKLEDADVVVTRSYFQPRLVPNAIEPRAALAVPGPAGDVTLYSATQIPHILRVLAAATLGLHESKVRVVAPDVGGGFGSKLDVYAEELLVLATARRLNRPVKWVEERSENFLATIHGRDVVTEYTLAATKDGEITHCRAKVTAAMGAYLQLVTPGVPLLGAFLYAGVYDLPAAYDFECTSVFTTMTPTDAYRGAGRPEATYAIERAMDALAAKIGIDPLELRRRNFIPTESFPYTAWSGLEYDSGDHHAAADEAARLVDYDALRARQATQNVEGATKRLGIGVSSYFEMCGLAPSRVLASLNYGAGGWEAATVRVLPTAKVQVVTGSAPHGQGHETSWSMIVADKLGISPDDIDVLHSDTAIAPLGLDTYGSRSLAVGGVAVALACDKVIDKAKQIAAHQLEASADDLEFSGGSFQVKGSPDRAMPLAAIAFEAFTAHNLPDGLEPNLEAAVTYDPPNFSWPFGTHMCVVEVDTETGGVDVLQYVAVDDCGVQVNPMIVDGQVHGGVVQGLAQALFEEAVYDEDGNL
jgi:carbon-monoxide dehydrogenase large subunit